MSEIKQINVMTNEQLQVAINQAWEMYNKWKTEWNNSKEIEELLMTLLKVQRQRAVQAVFDVGEMDREKVKETARMIEDFLKEL